MSIDWWNGYNAGISTAFCILVIARAFGFGP
jgi:hypothetical protein